MDLVILALIMKFKIRHSLNDIIMIPHDYKIAHDRLHHRLFPEFFRPLFTSEVELKRKFPTFYLNYRLKKFRSFGKIILLLVKMDPKSFFTDQLRVKSTDVPSLPHFAGASLILVLTMAFFSL